MVPDVSENEKPKLYARKLAPPTLAVKFKPVPMVDLPEGVKFVTPDQFEVATASGPARIAPGDWLAWDREGKPYPITDSVFQKTFDELEPRRGPAPVPHPFEYVAPTPASVEAIRDVRKAMMDLHDLILSTMPASRERSLAVTKLEESSMWANKAIVFSQKPATPA